MGNWRHANVAKYKVHFGNLYSRLQPFHLLFRGTSHFKGLNLSNLAVSLQPPQFVFQYLYSVIKVFSEFTYENSATNRRDLVVWFKVTLCFYLTELKKLRYLSIKRRDLVAWFKVMLCFYLMELKKVRYLSIKIIQRSGIRKLVRELS